MTIQIIKISFLIMCLVMCCSLNKIRLKNSGKKALLFYTIVNRTEELINVQLIEPGAHEDIETKNVWIGQFYTYPADECSNKTCKYPVTRVRFGLGQELIDGFYDFYAVSLNKGFSVPASITPMGAPLCRRVKCDADIFANCGEKEQIKDSSGNLLACKTSRWNYQKFQELCRDAIVNAGDPRYAMCNTELYEVSFG